MTLTTDAAGQIARLPFTARDRKIVEGLIRYYTQQRDYRQGLADEGFEESRMDKVLGGRKRRIATETAICEFCTRLLAAMPAPPPPEAPPPRFTPAELALLDALADCLDAVPVGRLQRLRDSLEALAAADVLSHDLFATLGSLSSVLNWGKTQLDAPALAWLNQASAPQLLALILAMVEARMGCGPHSDYHTVDFITAWISAH